MTGGWLLGAWKDMGWDGMGQDGIRQQDKLIDGMDGYMHGWDGWVNRWVGWDGMGTDGEVGGWLDGLMKQDGGMHKLTHGWRNVK